MAKKKPAKKAGRPPSKRGRKKGEQLHIAGMAPEKNDKIHPVAVSYVRLRDYRMELNKEEDDLKTRLLDLMKTAGLDHYEWDDINVMVSHKDDVKVKKAGKES